MANKTRWIKSRIKSVRETKKITRAMYLISASKVKKARENLDNTRPYFNKMVKLIYDVVKYGEKSEHIIFNNNLISSNRTGILVIGGDKGLCGGYNANIIKTTLKFIEDKNNYIIYPIGIVGRNYFTRKNFPVKESFAFEAQNPTVKKAKEISRIILRDYLAGEINELYIIYTKMISVIKQEIQLKKLLPLDLDQFKDEDKLFEEKLNYHPSVEDVFNVLIFEYVKGIVFGSIVESWTSELAARMTAMDNATKSADEMINKLTIRLNRERQWVITQEISEIIGGATALK